MADALAVGPRAVVLDFDDTIVETLELKAAAFRQLFADEPAHLTAITDVHVRNSGWTRFEKFRRIYRDVLNRPLSDQDIDRLDRDLRRSVYDGITSCPVVADARESLQRWSATLPIFVLSSTPGAELDSLLRRLDLDAFLRGSFGLPHRKPAVLQDIARRFDGPVQRILFVGDSQQDQHAAAEAGVTFVGRRALGGPPFSPVPALVVSDFAELDARWSDVCGLVR